MAKRESVYSQAQREIERINLLKSEFEARGYEFKNFRPELTNKGKVRRRYTRKQLELLRNINAQNLWQYGSNLVADLVIDNFVTNGWIKLTPKGLDKVREYIDHKVLLFGSAFVAEVLERANRDGVIGQIKQISYDFTVMNNLLGNANTEGLEHYFNDLYSEMWDRQEAERLAREIQELDDDEEDYEYDEDDLPFPYGEG